MLRAAALALGVIAVAGGALLLRAAHVGPGIYLLCLGAAIILGTIFERWRYRNTAPAAARWERTGERFEDPATGQILDVHYDRASGERRYVRSGASAPGK
jgi:hypothetical protein